MATMKLLVKVRILNKCPLAKMGNSEGIFGRQKGTSFYTRWGPLPVITGFITPITRVIRTVNHV